MFKFRRIARSYSWLTERSIVGTEMEKLSVMIIATVKIMPAREKRRELLDILQSVKGRVLAEAGCLCCCIYEEHGDENGVLYLEKWQSLASLEHNLKSISYGKILEAIELSAQEPEIAFHVVSETMGLELVERVRGAGKLNAEAP